MGAIGGVGGGGGDTIGGVVAPDPRACIHMCVSACKYKATLITNTCTHVYVCIYIYIYIYMHIYIDR